MNDDSISDSLSEDESLISEENKVFDKSMSAHDVASFLQEQGIPVQYCSAFEGI